MDIYVDPSGVVMVRNCGCGKHGLTSFWDDHDAAWQQQNRKEAEELTAKFAARPAARTTAIQTIRARKVVDA